MVLPSGMGVGRDGRLASRPYQMQERGTGDHEGRSTGVVCGGEWMGSYLGRVLDNLAISPTSTPITPIPSKDSGQAEPSPVKGEGRRWDPAFAGEEGRGRRR